MENKITQPTTVFPSEAEKQLGDQSSHVSSTTGGNQSTANAANIGGNSAEHVNKAGSDISGNLGESQVPAGPQTPTDAEAL